jgi:rod shape-determining protein MreC
MLEGSSPERRITVSPPTREGREVVQAFVGRHHAFFVLLAVLVTQLLLLSLQVTRDQKVRLLQVWAVAAFDPFERVLKAAVDTTRVAWRTYRDMWSAQQQNFELQLQLVAARSEIQRLSEKAAEAERLRALLDFRKQLPFPTVAAEVIASSPGEGTRAIFIDKGRDAGLIPNLAVITPEGVVGKLIEVFPYSAQVLLVTDASSGAGCLLERTRVQGILKGGGKDLCEVLYIMTEEPVKPGERVMTSGMDRIYPKGLLLGTVVSAGKGNIYKEITVKPAARLERLESVLVILGSSPGGMQARRGETGNP